MTDSKLTESVSRLLQAVNDERAGAEDELFQLVYDELHRIARSKMRREAPGSTLQTTALVNETYLRLVSGAQREWKSRAYFFRAAAEAMRRILVDHARRKHADRRGGGQRRATLDEATAADAASPDLVALDDALHALEQQDARKAWIVKLRYFVGLSIAETAALLSVSASTVDKEWKLAKAWLNREIVRGQDGTTGA